jgi:fermentation-respiration switch protein FrsA (DUF1100 family)
VLILHGTRDEVVPAEMGVRLAKLFPHARLELLEGASHAGLIAERGDGMAALIAAFARELPTVANLKPARAKQSVNVSHVPRGAPSRAWPSQKGWKQS